MVSDTPTLTPRPLGPIDLTRLPALRSVVFRVPHVWANGDPTCLWFPWVSSILTHAVLPRHLVHLGLELELDFDDEWMIDMGGVEPGLADTGRSIMEMELDRVLDGALTRERYPDLKRVDVKLLVHDSTEVSAGRREAEASKASWFPVLESRGLLTVGVGAVREPEH